MNRVLNIGNMSAQPFVDLKTGLHDWWENGSPIGVHASNDIDHASWTVIGDDPVGPWSNVFKTGSGYTVSPYSKFFGTILPKSEFTVAMVLKNMNWTTAVNSMWFRNGNDTIGMTYTYPRALNPYARGGYNYTGSGFPENQWLSFVFVSSEINGNLKLYRNGSVLVNSNATGAMNNTWGSLNLNTGNVHYGCIAVCEGCWSAQQVAHFHNGGSFRSYAQL